MPPVQPVVWTLLTANNSQKIPLREQMKPVTELIRRLPQAQDISHCGRFVFQRLALPKGISRWDRAYNVLPAYSMNQGMGMCTLTASSSRSPGLQPASSVHGIPQARILEWVVISFSREPSGPGDWTLVSCIGRHILYQWVTWDTHESREGKSLSDLLLVGTVRPYLPLGREIVRMDIERLWLPYVPWFCPFLDNFYNPHFNIQTEHLQ